MLGRQRPRQLQRRLVQLRGHQLVQRRVLGLDGIGHVLPADARDLVGHGAGGLGPPVQRQGPVDRHQHVVHPLGAVHHHHAAHVGGARDQPLAHPHQLALPAGVHAVRTRAVLARHLTHPRVDAQRRERAHHQARGHVEPLGHTRARVIVGDRVGERDGARVEDRSASAGQALDGLEAARAGRGDRLGIAAADHVALAERHDRARMRDPQRLRQVAGGHPQHQRTRDGRVQRGSSGNDSVM